MKIRGTLITFDKIYNQNPPHIFTKETKLCISEKLPLVWNFNFYNPEAVLGDVKAIVTDKGVTIEGDIFDESILQYIDDPSFGLGGFFTKTRHHEDEDGVMVIDEATISFVSIVPNPISDDLKFVIGGKLEAFKED